MNSIIAIKKLIIEHEFLRWTFQNICLACKIQEMQKKKIVGFFLLALLFSNRPYGADILTEFWIKAYSIIVAIICSLVADIVIHSKAWWLALSDCVLGEGVYMCVGVHELVCLPRQRSMSSVFPWPYLRQSLTELWLPVTLGWLASSPGSEPGSLALAEALLLTSHLPRPHDFDVLTTLCSTCSL